MQSCSNCKYPITVHLAHVYICILHWRIATTLARALWQLQAKQRHKMRKMHNKQTSNKAFPYNADFRTFTLVLSYMSQETHRVLWVNDSVFPEYQARARLNLCPVS